MVNEISRHDEKRYDRWLELSNKIQSKMTPAEAIELRGLHAWFKEFREQNPDWTPDERPLRVPLLQLARFR